MLSFLSENIEIWHYSGYRTTVYGEYFYELKNAWDLERLHEIYHFSKKNSLPLLFIGWGTNLLFSKDIYHWVVIKNSLQGWHYDKKTRLLKTSSNELIWKIAESLEYEHNNPLWHRFIWLPGSVWGAIYGNAGCFGLETESNFDHAMIYDMKKWKTMLWKKGDMWFAYRHSKLKENNEYFIIEAIFDLSKKKEKYHSDVDNIYFREYKQPKWYSCGSFWKNPSKEHSAGSLIEQVGLKWYRHGGARWSDLHANFLLSDGESCKPSDLIELVNMTHAKVKEKTGYDLINEVQIL
jgi:UDP-N-acetylmuramate dehydrogenase